MTDTDWHRLVVSLARVAALAPSSHNCQPWTVVCMAAEQFALEMAEPEIGKPLAPSGTALPRFSLLICQEESRSLHALPTLAREMQISIGGFTSLLLNLLHQEGVAFSLQWLGPHWTPATASGRHHSQGLQALIAIHIGIPTNRTRSDSLALKILIEQRKTYRGPFSGSTERVAVNRLPSPLPYRMANTFSWHTMSDRNRLNELSLFFGRIAPEDFRHGTAWRETYSYLRFGTSGHERASTPETGIPIESLMGPLSSARRQAYRLALHPAMLALLGPLGLHSKIGRDFEQLVASASGITYMTITDESLQQDPALSHFLAGEAIIDHWLSATQAGLVLHPLSVAIQHPHIERELRSLLGTSDPVIFIARYGRPATETHLPRVRRSPQTICRFVSGARTTSEEITQGSLC